MNRLKLIILLICLSFITLVLAMGIGSVYIHPMDTANILIFNLFGLNIFGEIDQILQTILWEIRVPRTFIAFISGSGLAISGTVMQSVLKNPLASSYTLGVSSGAALGASIAIFFNISIFGFLTLQVFGFTFGLATAIAAVVLASKLDKTMQNNSIILMGMAFSLFANAMLTIIMAASGEQLQRLIFWQMGSFAMRTWQQTTLLFYIVLIGFFVLFKICNEMDIMTLGDEQAQISGVEVKKIKWFLLLVASVITGSVVATVGIIGFVDLFTPHVARKLVGASHRYVLPAAALLGGIFMVVCDIIARTIVAPIELPVGAVTSVIGAPFFIYLYFNRRKNINDSLK